jgi:soluble lytic murein transglycosylase-like protein
VERTRAAVQGQAGSIAKQSASITKQRSSSKAVDTWEWSPAAKAILEIAPVALGCVPAGIADFDGLIRKHARREGLNEALVRAVVRRESGFNPCAVSRAGAQGLMQLMPETAEYLGVADPFDPEQNLAGGSRFLKMLLERYGGNLSLALGAYNAGPGRVDRLGRVPAIAETQNYVRTILQEIGANNARVE